MTVQQKVTTVVIRNEMTVTLHHPLESLGDLAPSFAFGLAALCYLVFLYFNFSGYTDMMIGLGRLMGFHLPENFDNPFRATSFLDFWKRWHISLSVWFRDYCFMPAWSATRGPVSKVMANMGLSDPAIATLPAYFISFGLLGLWHGRTWPFILCGLMFAAGSSANHLYRARLSRMKNKQALDHLNRNPLYRSFTSALTLFYISLAVTGLWLPGATFTTVWKSFSFQQATESFTLIVFCLTGVLYLGRKPWQAERVQAMLIRPVHDFFSGETSALIAAKMFLAVIWVFVFSAHITDFVYQRF
jgi:D-alanyl-lipoteichoic acid acyltransferase DltB (MBOAT superfamily)